MYATIKRNDKYGYDEFQVDVGKHKGVSVSIDIKSDDKYQQMSDRRNLARTLSKLDVDDLAEQCTKSLYDGPNSWVRDNKELSPVSRKEFKDNLHLRYVSYTPEWDTLMYGFDDGGKWYGGHAFYAEASGKNPNKLGQKGHWSIEG